MTIAARSRKMLMYKELLLRHEMLLLLPVHERRPHHLKCIACSGPAKLPPSLGIHYNLQYIFLHTAERSPCHILQPKRTELRLLAFSIRDGPINIYHLLSHVVVIRLSQSVGDPLEQGVPRASSLPSLERRIPHQLDQDN